MIAMTGSQQARTPRVLDDPVVFAIFCSVAYDQHTMVQSSSALLIKHATAIQLELPLISFDGHAHWLATHSLAAEDKLISSSG